MAVLFSIADGNINATASWGVVEPTSFQGTPNVTTNFIIGTTQQTGTSFILSSVVTISGVALQLNNRSSPASGTLNVQLFNVTSASIVGQVTINAIDLPTTGIGNAHIDWTYFKFATPINSISGNSYAIRVQTSVGSQVTCYYTTVTTNPNRALVTTTSQAPVASDQLIIAGSYTSAGVNSSTTITMNYTGSGYVILGNIWVSSKGILTFATNIGTYLPISGYLVVGVSGILNIGTSLNPITTSADIQMNCTTALQYPIWVYGTMTTYGQSKVIAAKLVGDVISTATSSTTSVVTGWKTGETIVVASTTRTYTQFDTISLNANASGTNLIHSNYTYAHGGDSTTKVQADMINASRNITIRGNGAPLANKTNIQMFSTSITSFYYTSFIGLGTGITVLNSGICVNILNSGYTFEMQYCFIGDNGQAAANTVNTALFNQNTTNTIISNNLFFGLGWTTTVASTINVYDFDDSNYVIGCLAVTQVLLTTNIGSNNTFSSNNTPVTISNLSNSSNNSFYSNNTIGLNISNPTITTATLTNYKIWRNNTYGISFTFTSSYNKNTILTFDGLYCFGNTSGSLATNRHHIKVYFTNSFFYGGSTLVQPNHFIGTGNIVDSFYYNNCYFGYSDTSLTSSPFSGAILQVPVPNVTQIFNNCYFNGTEISATTGYPAINITGSFLSLNHNGVTASHKQWFSNGTITSDLVIYSSSTKSLRLTPRDTIYKLNSPLVRVPVKSGTTCTISVLVRKSIAADGAVNNGAQARLMYAFNPALGNLTETIGDYTKNIFAYPQGFDNSISWARTAMTITPDSLTVAAPDGTFTADLFVEDNTTNRHRLLYNGIVLASGTYRLSIYAKKNAHDWIQLYPVSIGGNWSEDWANFNLNTGTIGNKGVGTTASITDAGNGWWRLSIQATLIISSGLNEFPVICLSTNNTNSGIYPSYLGTLAQCFYIWGAQITLGTTLLPYYDNGQWEPLTYTTATFSNDGVAEFYVDTDGFTGWINVDDWDVNTSVDSRTNDYWGVNATYVEPDFKRGTRSYTFVK